MEEARPTQDSEYMKKYYQGEDEREGGLSLVEKAGLGILTGVAGYAIARRTGLGHRFGQFIERDVKSYGQGIKEAIDRSPIPKLNGTNTDFTRIANQMKKDFQKGQKDFKETYDKKRAKLERREMDMERMIRQFTEITGKKNTSDGYMYTLIDDSMRYKRMVEEIKKSKNKQIKQHQSEIIKAVQSMNPNSIKRMSNKDFATHLRKNGIKDKALIGQVESVRMKTNSFNYLGKKDKQTIAMMNNNRKEMQNLFVQETKDLIKQNKFKNAVGGGELATVEDVLRLNASKKSKKFKLSGETVDFLNEAIKIDNSFKHAVFDRNLVIKKNKKKKTETIEDYNIYKDIKRKSLDWFSGTMPGGILHARDLSNILEGRDLFHTYVMRRGTQQPTINAQMGKENKEYLDEHVIKIGGKVVRAADERTLIDQKPLEILNPKRDIYLTSSMYGSIPRMVRHVGETMTENDTPYNNKMFEILDIGKQDKDNNFHKVTSIFSKFFDEDWTRNWAVNVMNQGLKDSEDYHRMNSFFRWNSKPLSNRTFHALNGQYDSLVQKKIDDLGINFSKDEDYIRLFEELGQKELEKKGSISDLGSVYKKYKSDPERFLKQKTPYGESSFIMGDQNMTRTGFDDIKVSLSGHLIGSAQRKIYYENPDLNMEQSMENIRSIFDDFYEQGTISRSDYIGSQEAVNYKLFQQAGANINRATASAIVKTNELFNDTRFYNTAMNTVKRGNPIWESTVKTKPENTTEDVMIAVNKSDVFSNMMGVLDSSKSVGERFKSFIDPFTQLSGGRDRMEDFTTLSMIPYYAGYRLQDMLGTIGLGLSDKSMGSSVQIASSLFMKRLLPAYMGVETYKYADYKMDQWTGEGIDERYQNMIANGRLDDAYDMTDEERQEELHKKQLKPGLEHWEAMPEVTLPFFGSIGMGHVANSVSNIFFADTDLEADSAMTPDEVVDDLYKGEEEVRKSRWWTAGSKSAYRGDRISEFAPNAFRQAHSDWEWSGTGLTGEEYFSTRLYPTLENPLGILGQMIGTVDPYTFENKHMEDRPYLLTGELFNPNTMFFGDVLNRTLGQSIKPVQQMHSEYWGTPSSVQEQTDNETDNSKRIRDTPITTQISPGGRMKNVIYGTPDDYGGYNDRQATGEMSPNIVAYNHERGRFITSNQKDAQGFSTGGMMLHDLSDNTTAYVPASVAKSGMSYSDIKEYAQTNDDTSKYIQYDGSPNYTQTYSAQVSTAPRAMYDEDYAYKNELRNRKLNNVYDPRTKEWGAQEFVENWSEPLGVYKWLFNDELLGYDPYSNKMVMEKADAATNFSDTFWESNLGSLGAEYSEFARRFIRRDDGNLDFYNPIENTMPDWLPGSNYFINFQSGDPYCVSPETLIETEKGVLTRADKVKTGDIIKTHKGVLRPVEAIKRREIKEEENLYKFTVATLPALPFTVSEGHPILTVKDPGSRRNYGQLKYIELYKQSNEIIELLYNNGPMKKKEIHEGAGLAYSRITLIMKHLVSEGIVKDNGRRKDVELLKYKPYDIELCKRGISWIEAKDVEIGDYVAYPLPEDKEEKVVLDMADYVDKTEYTIFDNYIRYGGGSDQFRQILEYLRENGVPKFKYGERKRLLEEKGWNPRTYESAQAFIRYKSKGFTFPRFIEINEEVATLFGYWVAEGSANKNLVSCAFHEKEVEYRNEIDECLNSLIGRKGITYECKDSLGVEYKIGCKPLAALLSKLFGNGARVKSLPEWFINLPNNVLAAFIRVLLNGDGFEFETSRSRVGLKTSSLKLAYQVRMILLKFRIVGSISENKESITVRKNGKIINSGTSYSLHFNGQAARKISDLIGYNIEKEEYGKSTTYYIDGMYLYLRVNKKEKLTRKNVPEVIGFQVGVDDSFCVAGVATHNTKVDHGERRLPGAGYESLNELHPDEFGDYGAFDRFKILGDVAPWSDEYKYWSQFLMDNLEDEDLRKEATEIRHQVSDRKAKYDFQKYRFKDNDVEWYDVKVDKILDGTTFKSKEFGEQAIRLAGVDHHQNPDGLLDAYLDEGQTVRIGIAKDESKRISKDTYKTMNAVILDGTYNINQDIIQRGFMRENENDFSAPGIQSRFTKSEISQGKRWETMAHADNPFNTKFLQVRTAVEEYERDQIYGKDWATWQNLAIRDYLMPTLEGLGRRDGVLESATLGGMFGYTMGIFLLHGGRERKMATALGALIGVASNIGMRTYEKNHGEKWKPERRRVEEDINEYFDFLDYTKYSGLYENAREEILHQTGVDTEDIVGQVNDKKKHHKELKKELERERKQLYLEQPKGWEKRKKEINQQIKQMGEDGKVELELPDYIVKALQYREKRDTTIYGIDPTQDLMQVQKAMPYKDKWFFMEFVNATDSEKEELMKILPQNQKRIYNAIWTHQNTEAPPPPEYFFSKYGGVPDEYWEGWRSDIDLKDIKAQVVKEAGLDLTDFGLWQDDLYNKPYVPSLQPEGGNNIYEAKDFKGYGVMEDNLYKAMQGAGIYDARIVVSPNDTGITNVNINIEEDRTKEVSDNLYYNRDEYI